MVGGYFRCLCGSLPGTLHLLVHWSFPQDLLSHWLLCCLCQVLHSLCRKNILPVVMFPLEQSSPPLLQTTPLCVCHTREMACNLKNGLACPTASSLATLLTGDVGEAGIQHDKTCLPELPKVSLFCFLVCSTLTRSGGSIWQWVTHPRLPCESAAQAGRAQECWWLGLLLSLWLP